MASSHRDSSPPPATSIAPDGLVRPGLVYVDDSETSLAAMRRALRGHGVLLETFPSATALAARERDPAAPPLLAALLDVDLGRDAMSGLEIARRLRAARPSVAVAFFTVGSGVPSERLRELGPVFCKETARDAAVAWLLARVATDAIK